MKKILFLVGFLSLLFSWIGDVSAYRVNATSWLGAGAGGNWPASDGNYYRIYNPRALQIFVPGRDDAGNYNLTNWNTITISKSRPGLVRIHRVTYPGVWVTNCASATAYDSAVNYATTTTAFQNVTSSTTVLRSDWVNRVQYTVNYAYDGEMRCDFGALFNY